MTKRSKVVKTREARAEEVRHIRAKLSELGFVEDDLSAVDTDLGFFEAHAASITNTHKFPHLGVVVHLVLSTQPHITSHARVSGDGTRNIRSRIEETAAR